MNSFNEIVTVLEMGTLCYLKKRDEWNVTVLYKPLSITLYIACFPTTSKVLDLTSHHAHPTSLSHCSIEKTPVAL